nr:hypothetical protein [Rhizobium leguminosarum]
MLHGIGAERTGRRASQGDHREKLQEGLLKILRIALPFEAFVDLD